MVKNPRFRCKECGIQKKMLKTEKGSRIFFRCPNCLLDFESRKTRGKKNIFFIFFILFIFFVSLIPSNAYNYYNISFIDEKENKEIETDIKIYRIETSELFNYSYKEIVKLKEGEWYYIYGCENNKDYYSNRITASNNYPENKTINKVYDCWKKGALNHEIKEKINKEGNFTLRLYSKGYVRKVDFCIKSEYLNLKVNYPQKEIPQRLKGEVDSCYIMYYSFLDNDYNLKFEINKYKGSFPLTAESKLKIVLIDNELDYLNNYYDDNDGLDIGIKDYVIELKENDIYSKKTINLYIRKFFKIFTRE